MKEKGWRPFWAALLAALLVLLPLVGGTVLLTRRSLRTRLASRPQSGVAIRQPKEENRLSLLVCIAPTETTAPGFLLLYRPIKVKVLSDVEPRTKDVAREMYEIIEQDNVLAAAHDAPKAE